MYITSSRSYRQILLTVLKVIGVVSIFVAPIALFQVISASKEHNGIEREDGIRQSFAHPSQLSEMDLHTITAGANIGQLGELFDVSQRTGGRDSKSILRLKRQTDDDSKPSLAQLTAAGTAAGMLLGDQMVAAQMATTEANYDPDLTTDTDEDDESEPNAPIGQSNVDLSTLQSLKQPASQDGLALDRAAQEQQQDHQADNINPEQMPYSMESLMRSEQEDLGADQQGDSDQSTQEQPSASSQVVGDQQTLTESDEDENDTSDQNPLFAAANLPRSYLVPQEQTSELFQSAQNDLSGVIFPNEIASPVIDSSGDLNAAAGHHYKKKKKKKVRKIIIKKKKKGKKYKKLKKVKIIKYKKKKVVKKKKKPMKHHHHDHGKYYMYAKVPKKKSWEFGFKKGNKKHWIERHEKGHKSKFKTKVKWFDKKSKGKGVHIWDYNHHDKKKKKHY